MPEMSEAPARGAAHGPGAARPAWPGPPRILTGGPTQSAAGTRSGRLPHDVPAWERPSLWATLKGLGVTLGNFARHLWSPNRMDQPTVQYPEQRRAYSPRFRGIHQLTKRPDGSLKCVACFMCATACPAECITISGARIAISPSRCSRFDRYRCTSGFT